MNVNYFIAKDGGFVAYVPGTNLAAYSYPSSNNARWAVKNPEATAKKMISAEIGFASVYVETVGYPAMVERASHLLADLPLGLAR